MAGLVRLILAAVILAIVAKVIERMRRDGEDQPTPEWPSWSERRQTTRPPVAETPTTAREASVDTVGPDGAGNGAWATPVDGECPAGYPVKAKTRSRIYHLEGMLNYERTHADRCYSSPEAAEADGFRASKV